MRYLLIAILISFTGCATTSATRYDKKQNAVMKLSAEKYLELLKKYQALEKVVDKQKKSLSFLNMFTWGMRSFVFTLNKNSNKAFAYSVKNRIAVAHILKELEKISKALKKRGIIKR